MLIKIEYCNQCAAFFRNKMDYPNFKYTRWQCTERLFGNNNMKMDLCESSIEEPMIPIPEKDCYWKRMGLEVKE